MSPFQRWYDQDPFLSTMVYALECMQPESQGRFARLLGQVCDRLLRAQLEASGYQKLDPCVVRGIKKSHLRRRWYDQTPDTQKAFNKLYALTETERNNLAHRFFIAAQLIHRYESYCQQIQTEPNSHTIDEIIRTNLKEGPERALKLYGFYLDESISPVHPV